MGYMHPPLLPVRDRFRSYRSRSLCHRARSFRAGRVLAVAVAGLLVGCVSTALLFPTTPVAADPPANDQADVLAHHEQRQAASADVKPVVYLTFDDGPDIATADLLAVLKTYDIKATFFVTGRNVLNFPDTALHTAVEGHAIANHTYDHSWLTRVDPTDQLSRGQEAIEMTLGISPSCYRPPYGATDDRVRSAGARLGLTEWLWDLDTHDWRRSVTTDDMIESLETAATFDYSIGKNGTNVLMHDGGNDGLRTVEAMTVWLEENHDRYDFRLIEGCGGQPSRFSSDARQPVTVQASLGTPELSQFQTETLFGAFMSQGIDVEGWNVWRKSWRNRILGSPATDA